MKKLLLLFLMLACTLSVYGASINKGKISKIYLNGGVYFQLENDPCNDANHHYYFNTTDNDSITVKETKKAWLSLILMAAQTRREITVRTTNCAADQNEPVGYMIQTF